MTAEELLEKLEQRNECSCSGFCAAADEDLRVSRASYAERMRLHTYDDCPKLNIIYARMRAGIEP